MNLTGVQEWATREYEEKTATEQSIPLPVLNLTAGKLKGEYNLDHSNLFKKTASNSHNQLAFNALLAWLEFPVKLHSFLNSIIAVSLGSNEPFTATDLKLGKQMKIGRKAKSESTRKNFTRAKKQFREWQIEKNFCSSRFPVVNLMQKNSVMSRRNIRFFSMIGLLKR